jgi:hypothetical protein
MIPGRMMSGYLLKITTARERVGNLEADPGTVKLPNWDRTLLLKKSETFGAFY